MFNNENKAKQSTKQKRKLGTPRQQVQSDDSCWKGAETTKQWSPGFSQVSAFLSFSVCPCQSLGSAWIIPTSPVATVSQAVALS